MGRLIDFLLEYRHLFTFLGLQLISFILIVNFNQRQEAVFTQFTLELRGYFQETSAGISAFVNLRGENEKLQKENIELRKQMSAVKNELNAYKYRIPFSREFTTLPDSVLPINEYLFMPCRAIHNSVETNYNFITLNAGSKHGVQKGMGVVSSDGIVGRVVYVSPNYSAAISLLNKHFSLNAKIYGKDIQGAFKWHGGDVRYGNLDFVPLHHKVSVGDTIVSSQYSAVFPEGFVLGHVASVDPREPDGFYEITVKLKADFHRLDYLYLIRNIHLAEIDSLKQKVK